VTGESFFEAFADAPEETKGGAGAAGMFDSANPYGSANANEKTAAFDDLIANKTQHAA
jgi:hypothetical protein